MIDKLYNHILVPTDFRLTTREAYRVAFATALGCESQVSLLHVIPKEDESEFKGMDAFRLLHQAAARSSNPLNRSLQTESEMIDVHLDRLRNELHPEWMQSLEVNLAIRIGEAATEISQFIMENSVDLVVMVTSRPRWLKGLGWSLSEQIARTTKVKVVRVTPPVRV
jgi:nucleotide-binding universal stress UspA family protein